MSTIVRGASALTLLAFTACGRPSVEARNNQPDATIAWPLAGDALVAGYTTRFRGSVTDTNHHPEDLVATWLLDGEELCAEAPVEPDGGTTCETVLAEGDGTVTLRARDPLAAEGETTLELDVRANTPPTVTLLAPGSGPWSSEAYILFEAVVADAEDAADALTVAWTDEEGDLVDLDVARDTDGSLSGALRLEPGAYTFTLTATDVPGASGSASVSFEVVAP